MAVDTNHAVFSSEPNITIVNNPPGQALPMFIAMDPPKHDVQRKAVSPIVAPANLANFQHLIRERTCRVLDGLPRGTSFDWVERVSIELTRTWSRCWRMARPRATWARRNSWATWCC
ncbi:MAG TPA: hypothetical protein VLJ19_13265 [Variovorax sp.]|nr:hypothetical protein [Variovorax sp.]